MQMHQYNLENSATGQASLQVREEQMGNAKENDSLIVNGQFRLCCSCPLPTHQVSLCPYVGLLEEMVATCYRVTIEGKSQTEGHGKLFPVTFSQK